MNKKESFYLLLFGLLIILVFVHPAFVLLLFTIIIVLVVRAAIKWYRRSSNTQSRKKSGGAPKDLKIPESQVVEPTAEAMAKGRQDNREPVADLANTKVRESGKNQKIGPKGRPPVFVSPENKGNAADGDHMQNPTGKDSWEINPEQDVLEQKTLILRAMEFCRRNDLGSPGRIRRMEKKIEKWGLENRRDIDAFLPEYAYLVSLIRVFQAD